MIYLDTSAVVKLVNAEPQTDELANWLDEHTEMHWISSVLVEVELARAVIRSGRLEQLATIPVVKARLDLFEIDDVVRSTAASFHDPGLRSLDAIHLATARVAASVAELAAFVTYDRRLASAAADVGLPAVMPGLG